MRRITQFLVGAFAAGQLACSDTDGSRADVVETKDGRVRIEKLADGLSHPWGMAFLPDGRLLVTERDGQVRIVSKDGKLSEPLKGVPEVYARGQGGLLDVALDPDFAENRLIYLTYSEARSGGAGTTAARGRLTESGLENVTVIFRQEPAVSGSGHFGSRIAFSPDGKLFIGMGDRRQMEPAQDLSNHIGTIVRLERDGRVPKDNPFVNRKDARPEIWSYGHRNIQGMALHPETGRLWINEHGPRGGDEVNVIEPGRNYGWPLVSWGRHYSGQDIDDPPTRPDLAQSIYQWTPVIAASGMDFYTSDRFSGWRGDLLVGGLVAEAVVKLELDGQKVTGEERIPIGARVRQVRQGPDGAVYVLTDEEGGAVLRLVPAD